MKIMSRKRKRSKKRSSKKSSFKITAKPMKGTEILLLTISGMVLLGSIIWFLSAPGFEPLLILLGEIGGIVAIRTRFIETSKKLSTVIGAISIIVFGLGLYLVFNSDNIKSESSIDVENFEQVLNTTNIEQNYYEYPDDKNADIRAILDEGNEAFSRQRYSIALRYYEIARDKSIELGDEEGKIISFINIGIVHAELGDTEQAFENLNQANMVALDNDLFDLSASALMEMGNVYYNLGFYMDALSQYRYAESALSHTNNVVLLADVTRFISYSYDRRYEEEGGGEDFLDKKLEYALKSIEYSNQTDNYDYLDSMQIFAGEAYQQMGELDKALQYFLQSANNDDPMMPFLFASYIRIAEVNYLLGNNIEAYKYYRLAAIRLENGNVVALGEIRSTWDGMLNDGLDKLILIPNVKMKVVEAESHTSKYFWFDDDLEFEVVYSKTGEIMQVFPRSP